MRLHPETRRALALAACGLGMVAVYAAGFSVPYSIAGGLAKPLLDFAKISGPSLGPTLGLVAASLALFALYAIALGLCRHVEGSRLGLLVVVGFGCLTAMALWPMHPVFSLDLFYYMAADRIWTVYHENPFVVPPLQAAHDPFFPYTPWGHYPLPYGPLWPWISAGASALGGGAVTSTLLAFKGLAILGYLACLPLVVWAAAAIRPERRLTGLCIFAWNPLVLLELAGNGHNDAIALVPAALALGLWARRRSALSAAALAVSFLVKATGLVLVLPLLWPSFFRAATRTSEPSAPSSEQHIAPQAPEVQMGGAAPNNVIDMGRRAVPGALRWGLTHILPAVVLCVLAWLPFWTASGAFGFLRELDQHYASVTAVLMAPVPPSSRPWALDIVQGVALLGFALYGLTQLRFLASEGQPALRATWRLTVLFFVLVQPFYVGWYMLWPVLLSAMLIDRRTTVLTTLLCFGSLATYLVQFVLVPIAGPSLGWAQRNVLTVLVAFGPFAAGWAALSWRQGVQFLLPAPR